MSHEFDFTHIIHTSNIPTHVRMESRDCVYMGVPSHDTIAYRDKRRVNDEVLREWPAQIAQTQEELNQEQGEHRSRQRDSVTCACAGVLSVCVYVHAVRAAVMLKASMYHVSLQQGIKMMLCCNQDDAAVMKIG